MMRFIILILEENEIKYENDCININENGSHIYISHKNIYLSVYFIEKILLKNEKKIKIENKNAIFINFRFCSQEGIF